jgi:hypothetical protein
LGVCCREQVTDENDTDTEKHILGYGVGGGAMRKRRRDGEEADLPCSYLMKYGGDWELCQEKC